MRTVAILAALFSMLALAGCGEKVQTASHKKFDNAASKGANPASGTPGAWSAIRRFEVKD